MAGVNQTGENWLFSDKLVEGFDAFGDEVLYVFYF